MCRFRIASHCLFSWSACWKVTPAKAHFASVSVDTGFIIWFLLLFYIPVAVRLVHSPFTFSLRTRNRCRRKVPKTNLSRLMSRRPFPVIHPGRYVPLRAFVAWDTVRISTYSTGYGQDLDLFYRSRYPRHLTVEFRQGALTYRGLVRFRSIDIHVLNSRRRVWRLVLSCFLFSWK